MEFADKVEGVLWNSGKYYSHDKGLFKVTFYIEDLTIDVNECYTVVSRDSFYHGGPNTQETLDYIASLLK